MEDNRQLSANHSLLHGSKPTWRPRSVGYLEGTVDPFFSNPPQVKRLKDLEKEKDVLFCGLEVLDETRLWYLQRLEGNKARRNFILEARRQLGHGQVAALEDAHVNSEAAVT